MLERAALGFATAGLTAQAAQNLRGQLAGGQFGFARSGRAIGVDVLHEAHGVPNPKASAKGLGDISIYLFGILANQVINSKPLAATADWSEALRASVTLSTAALAILE